MRAIRSLDAFPADGQIEIIEAGRGSFSLKLGLYLSIVSTVAAVGSLAVDIAGILKQPDSELAKCVAWTMVEDGVTKVGIKCHGEHDVLKEQMPAVSRIVEGRIEHSRRDEYDDGTGYAVDSQDLSNALDTAVYDGRGTQGPPSDDLPDHSTFFNIPPAPDTIELHGRFRKRSGDVLFIQPNGQIGLLEEQAETDELPFDLLVAARLSAVRGPRGGWPDRRVRVVGWVLPEEEQHDEEPQRARGIWQRGGDDEEFDPLPGQQTDDLRTISNPGHDLNDERASIEQQPVMAFVGELVREGDYAMIVTNDGDTFLLDGDIDYSNRQIRRNVVIIGRAAVNEDELGRRRLLVNEMYPLHS